MTARRTNDTRASTLIASRLVGAVFAVSVGSSGCAGAQRTETRAATGWTITYTHRTGVGLGSARDVRPDLRVEVLDQRFRVTSPERGLDVRADAVRRVVHSCRDGRCAQANDVATLAAVTAIDEGPAAPGLREAEPVTETISEPDSIVNVATRGARFTSVFRTAAGAFRATVEVRWIEEAGEPAVEAVKALFLAPVVRRGLMRLADEIRRTVGLPLSWQMHVGIDRGDAPAEGQTSLLRAAALEDPPARLQAP